MKPGFLAALLSLLLVSAATASSFALEMMNATFKIYHPDSTATCFLIRRDVPGEAHFLVATAHTLDRIPSDTAVVVLREKSVTLERADGEGIDPRETAGTVVERLSVYGTGDSFLPDLQAKEFGLFAV